MLITRPGDAASTCRIECLEAGDVLDKIAYTMANPVSAGLVAHGHNWPGVRGAWPMRPRIVRRPPGFFLDEDSGGSWPEEATLEFYPPPRDDASSEDDLAALVRGAIDEHEEKARAKAKADRRGFLGRQAVLRQPRHAYPTSSEVRFTRCPTIACRSKWVRIERLRRDRDWLERYEAARERTRAGETNVLFPYGTWKVRVYYSASCEPPPDPATLQV